ncbi:MAG: class I SAM-dependent methyltransferase [Bryobacterales bacterium]|nr:class I SAM-dependent methyltransferase [Bryobacterales bacterium]
MSNAYDETPYFTCAQSRLHIEHLQLRAALNGFSTAPPETSRVLEVGCGTGFNLGPMAVEFPHARFVGIDYAQTAIAQGKEAMESLGLHNLELRHADLRDVVRDGTAAELGKFDYVIIHGLYSWVAEDVREALWNLLREVLAPAGVIHLSYAALPGWHAVRAVRDFAGFLAGDRTRPFDAYEATWHALGVLAAHAESEHPLVIEALRIRNRVKHVLLHDELGVECEPFYLTDVVRRAEREGFRFAGEAGQHVPSDLRRYPDVAQMVLDLSRGDSLLCLQLLDFTAMRRFHDTLFVRADQTPVKRDIGSLLLGCWARSDIRFVEQDESGGRTYEYSGGVRLTSANPMLVGFADALQKASPGSISLSEFLSHWSQGSEVARPELEKQLCHLVMKILEASAIELHPREIPVARSVEAYPRVSEFARMQMARDHWAPDVYHESMPVEEPWKQVLFTLLDGTRNQEDLIEALTEITWREISDAAGAPQDGITTSAVFRDQPERMASREAVYAFYRGALGGALEEFCTNAYLLPSPASD